MKSKYTILVIIILLLITNCNIKRTSKITEKIIYPEMIQNNYTHFIYKNGKKYLHAEIEYAEFFKVSETIECKTLNTKIYIFSP